MGLSEPEVKRFHPVEHLAGEEQEHAKSDENCRLENSRPFSLICNHLNVPDSHRMNNRKKECFKVQVSTRSSLARFVLFIVCLSIAGSIVAGVHYYVVDLPQQKALQAPANDCGQDWLNCRMDCDEGCSGPFEWRPSCGSCLKSCDDEYPCRNS